MTQNQTLIQLTVRKGTYTTSKEGKRVREGFTEPAQILLLMDHRHSDEAIQDWYRYGQSEHLTVPTGLDREEHLNPNYCFNIDLGAEVLA